MIEPRHRDDPPAGPVSSSDDGANGVTARVASAVVLALVALAVAYVGGAVFLALCAVAAGGILGEWVWLVRRRADARILTPGLLALAAAAAFIGLGRLDAAAAAIAVGAMAACLITAARPLAPLPPGGALWAGGGVIYAGAALFGPAVLRRDPTEGFIGLLFLFATVWMTDIFAFACGRAVGGPLLWPRISPRKTWAGAIGGVLGGVAAGVAVAYASGIGRLGIVGVMALLLSLLAQAGDLFESAVKRRFGAKDASRLIPGHGGLMDRLDGFLVAAAAALIIGVVRQGTATPARGLLLW